MGQCSSALCCKKFQGKYDFFAFNRNEEKVRESLRFKDNSEDEEREGTEKAANGNVKENEEEKENRIKSKENQGSEVKANGVGKEESETTEKEVNWDAVNERSVDTEVGSTDVINGAKDETTTKAESEEKIETETERTIESETKVVDSLAEESESSSNHGGKLC